MPKYLYDLTKQERRAVIDLFLDQFDANQQYTMLDRLFDLHPDIIFESIADAATEDQFQSIMDMLNNSE